MAVSLALVAGGARSQALDPVSLDTDTDVTNSGIDELTDGIKTLSPARQKALFPIYLAHKMPINLPGFWKLVTNPDDAWTMLRFFNEPYSPEILDVLERVLPAASKEKKLRIGAILYRYDRPIGYATLSGMLNQDSDLQATATFALNRDRTKLPQILKALSAAEGIYEQHLNYHYFLVREISDWHDPLIASALREEFRRRPNFTPLALALAAQDDAESIPLVRSLYATADSISKVDAAAALVRLDGSHAQTALLFLTLGLEPKAGEDAAAKSFDFEDYGQLRNTTPSSTSELKLIAFEDFGRLKIKTAVPSLRVAVVHYLSVEASGRPVQPEPLARPLELALAAAESLGQIGDAASIPLLVRLLRHLRATPDSDVESIRVTDTLLQLNAPRKEVDKLMGERWVQRRIQIRQLKRLPLRLLPSVKDF